MHEDSVLMSSTTTKLHLSFISKTVIIFCSFILGITLYNVITYDKTSASNINYFSSLISSSQITSTQCHLSMLESDGWFCEQDSDWKRRKMIHHIQDKRNRISDKRQFFFQNNWEPTIQCAFERRLGNTGDGGKWICDVHRFEEMNDTHLLIYSFGSNGDFSFERAIKEQLSKAEIHTFDMGLFKCPDNVCTFHQARLGNGKTDGSKSLQMIINDLGHQKRPIHILKVDIEGSEFNLFEELFNPSSGVQADIPYIRQILFEIHLGGGVNEEPSRRTHRLFELFRANNYAIFHKEANLFDPQNVFEYALLRLNSAFFNASV
jgi:hypothetical protein